MSEIGSEQINRWDKYFFDLSDVVKNQSRCLSSKVGCVIVKDFRFVVSTGYNGPPPGMCNPGTKEWEKLIFDNVPKGLLELNDGVNMSERCIRRVLGFESGTQINYCPCSCAERNALSIASRLGHSTDDCIMYISDKSPCRACSQSIVTAGIKEVIVRESINYEKEGISGQTILTCCGVGIRVVGR